MKIMKRRMRKTSFKKKKSKMQSIKKLLFCLRFIFMLLYSLNCDNLIEWLLSPASQPSPFHPVKVASPHSYLLKKKMRIVGCYHWKN